MSSEHKTGTDEKTESLSPESSFFPSKEDKSSGIPILFTNEQSSRSTLSSMIKGEDFMQKSPSEYRQSPMDTDSTQYSSNVFFPLDLSAQFQDSDETMTPVKKRAPKLRNKRSKEVSEYDILQLDSQIRACFEEEHKKIHEYKKRVESIANVLAETSIPFGVDEDIINDVENIVRLYSSKRAKKDYHNASDERNYSPPKKTKNLEHEKNSKDRLNFTYKDFLCFYEQIKRLIQKIENISTGSLLKKYEELTCELLEEYREILTIPVKIAFLSKSKPKNNNSSKKKKLLEEYLSIAGNFIDISTKPDLDMENKTVWICSNCSSPDYEDNDFEKICTDCGLKLSKISEQTTFRDTERLNLHTKYRYEKKLHFKECIQQYQGKQNKRIEPEIYELADNWLRMHGLIADAENKSEKYKNVTKAHIKLFMTESENPQITKHYEDLNLIYFNMTGIPCPDISHLEDILYAQFDKLVDAFLYLEGIERVNFLNGQFTLRKLLLINNEPFNQEDFPGLKTVGRRDEHETLWAEMIKIAGINDPGLMRSKKF